MARRGAANEDLSNVEFETSEDVEVIPTFNSMVSDFGYCFGRVSWCLPTPFRTQ